MRLFCYVAVIAAANTFAIAAVPSFRLLGDLPGGPVSSRAWSVSGDGSTVVGDSASAAGGEAFVWTAATGMQSIGDLTGGPTAAYARGISGNGTYVVGSGTDASGRYCAFRWTSSSGMTNLAVNVDSYARSVSNDGTATGRANGQACLFQPDGAIRPIGPASSYGYGISRDGAVVVGKLGDFAIEAFRWTPAEGLLHLGYLPGGNGWSFANQVSASGQYIVGQSKCALSGGYEAFLWSQENGMTGLGFLSGTTYRTSEAYGVSDNGIVVGSSRTAYGSENDRAFIWDRDHGMRSLQSLLTDLGLDLGGRNLAVATAISPDGTTIVGYDSGEHAWIATIPEPATALLVLMGAAPILSRRIELKS